MNLHGLVAPIIAAVNPMTAGTVFYSDGYTQDPIGDGTQIPAYSRVDAVPMQVQALTGKDLEHVSGLNLQGVLRGVYMNGNTEGVVRPYGKGGDILVFHDRTWLVGAVLETWDTSGWCKVAVVQQKNSELPQYVLDQLHTLINVTEPGYWPQG